MGLCLSLLMMSAMAAPSGTALLVRMGHPRLAIQQARGQLLEEPDNLDAMAGLGIAQSRAGYFADAAAAFALSEGAPLYEEMGIESHANTLRALGAGGEAAALRSQRLLVNPLGSQTAFRLWMALSDDHQSTGDVLAAIEMTEAGLAQFPESSMLHAQMAELLFALGQDEDGEFHLWLAAHFGAHQRWVIAEGYRRLSVGDVVGARALAPRFYDSPNPNARFAVFYADVLCANGEAETAQQVLTGGVWALTDDPIILAARMRLHTARSQWALGLELSEHAQRTYPNHRGLQQAITAHRRAMAP